MDKKRSGILVGTAGVYFVASQLAARGFHAAPTFGNAPNVDILAGLPDGSATISIQVKTAWKALRYEEKGSEKHPDHYKWDVGQKSGCLNKPNLFFTFVDLKSAKTELPDVFVIPSEIIFKAFDNSFFKSGIKRRWRYHRKIEDLSQYKNNRNILSDYLKNK